MKRVIALVATCSLLSYNPASATLYRHIMAETVSPYYATINPDGSLTKTASTTRRCSNRYHGRRGCAPHGSARVRCFVAITLSVWRSIHRTPREQRCGQG